MVHGPAATTSVSAHLPHGIGRLWWLARRARAGWRQGEPAPFEDIIREARRRILGVERRREGRARRFAKCAEIDGPGLTAVFCVRTDFFFEGELASSVRVGPRPKFWGARPEIDDPRTPYGAFKRSTDSRRGEDSEVFGVGGGFIRAGAYVDESVHGV